MKSADQIGKDWSRNGYRVPPPPQKLQLLIVNTHANDRHRRLSEHGHKATLPHNPNRFLAAMRPVQLAVKVGQMGVPVHKAKTPLEPTIRWSVCRSSRAFCQLFGRQQIRVMSACDIGMRPEAAFEVISADLAEDRIKCIHSHAAFLGLQLLRQIDNWNGCIISS